MDIKKKSILKATIFFGDHEAFFVIKSYYFIKKYYCTLIFF